MTAEALRDALLALLTPPYEPDLIFQGEGEYRERQTMDRLHGLVVPVLDAIIAAAWREGFDSADSEHRARAESSAEVERLRSALEAVRARATGLLDDLSHWEHGNECQAWDDSLATPPANDSTACDCGVARFIEGLLSILATPEPRP